MLKVTIQSPDAKTYRNAAIELIDRALNTAGEKALAVAQEHVPVASGNLRDSLTIEREENSVAITTDVPYAAAVEYGSFSRKATPFLLPAAEAGLAAFVDAFNNGGE